MPVANANGIRICYETLGSPSDPALVLMRGVWPGCESRQILATMATGDRAAYCRRIRIPTLVVHGTEDPLVPFEEGRLTAELIPAAQFEAVEGMGHELTAALVMKLLPIIQSFAARTLSGTC
jgi:proline iminopeptidase